MPQNVTTWDLPALLPIRRKTQVKRTLSSSKKTMNRDVSVGKRAAMNWMTGGCFPDGILIFATVNMLLHYPPSLLSSGYREVLAQSNATGQVKVENAHPLFQMPSLQWRATNNAYMGL
jgi:hypothetical protein